LFSTDSEISEILAFPLKSVNNIWTVSQGQPEFQSTCTASVRMKNDSRSVGV
jgi:hypothetical protein